MTASIHDELAEGLRRLPQPEPSAGLAAYREELRLALAGDPRRQANYDLYLATRRAGPVAEYLPVKLDFENVSRCNFRCTMCMVSEWEKGRRAADMDLDAFIGLLDEQYGLVEIKLQGVGEPLMQGDDLFAMIRAARARHIWVRTTTNASLLHLKNNWRKLVDAGTNEIQISVDGADKETFEAIRRGAVFERVVENSRMINEYCASQSLERTKMWTVVQAGNIGQLDRLVDLAADMKFTNMVFSLDLNDWGQEQWTERNAPVRVDPRVLLDQAESLMARGRERGVRVAFWSILDKYSTASRDRLCPWPFERAFISSDLKVVPCCMIANPEVFHLGDATAGLSALWQGPDYQAFRNGHLTGEIPPVCRGCYGG